MSTDTFEVLADPTRRRIIELLRRGERPVNDIVGGVDVHQSGVSRHLRILHEAGFVRVRAEGAQRFYALCPSPFRELDAWLSGYRTLWNARLDRLGEALVRRQRSRGADRKSGAGIKRSTEKKP